MLKHEELLGRARKSYRTLHGVIVVSPKLIVELIEAVESAVADRDRALARTELEADVRRDVETRYRAFRDAADWARPTSMSAANRIEELAAAEYRRDHDSVFAVEGAGILSLIGSHDDEFVNADVRTRIEMMPGTHFGRSFSTHQLEDRCPCTKAPCGLVDEVDAACTEHPPELAKTIRQSHDESQCPAIFPRPVPTETKGI
jgi:hypothetical protein